jgi:hypothetical protein
MKINENMTRIKSNPGSPSNPSSSSELPTPPGPIISNALTSIGGADAELFFVKEKLIID